MSLLAVILCKYTYVYMYMQLCIYIYIYTHKYLYIHIYKITKYVRFDWPRGVFA